MKICAPFAGTVRYNVADGDSVETGAVLAVVEAVKLEAPVLAPGPGVVRREIHEDFVDVAGGDVLVELMELGVSGRSDEASKAASGEDQSDMPATEEGDGQ